MYEDAIKMFFKAI